MDELTTDRKVSARCKALYLLTKRILKETQQHYNSLLELKDAQLRVHGLGTDSKENYEFFQLQHRKLKETFLSQQRSILSYVKSEMAWKFQYTELQRELEGVLPSKEQVLENSLFSEFNESSVRMEEEDKENTVKLRIQFWESALGSSTKEPVTELADLIDLHSN